jgi:3-dehydroquinate synthase
MAEPALKVHGGDVPYPIFIGEGVLTTELPDFLQQRGIKRAGIITNEVVGPLYAGMLVESLNGDGTFIIALPDGEVHKTLGTVQTIYDRLLEHGADRSTALITLGGGVIGDTAGYAAATFMRGVPLIQCPTTLLAMVDSSIGGKTGVDLPQGKNLVGAFRDPLAVFADTRTLATLPAHHFRDGMSEVVKAALIGDPPLLDLMSDAGNLLDEIIRRAIKVKADIVERDRLETGERANLNLGHTFAHAIELVSEFRVSHGHAVGIGLVAAATLSERLGYCDSALVGRIRNLLHGLYGAELFRPLTALDPEALVIAMGHDKKWRDGRSHFILIRAPGYPFSAYDVPREMILNTLKSLTIDQ